MSGISSANVSRYRPAILAVIGLAAAYGIYALYKVPPEPTKRGLHRSNAVRRSRPPRSDNVVAEVERLESFPPEPNNPLGRILLARGDESITLHLGADQLPSTETLQTVFGNSSQEFQDDIELAAMHMILLACYVARSNEDRSQIALTGLGGLPEALEARNEDRIHSFADSIALVLGRPRRPLTSLAIQSFMDLQPYLSGQTVRILHPDEEIAETEADNAAVDGSGDVDGEPGQGLKGLLYHIAEEQAKLQAYEHRGVHCDECNAFPIRGIRWHCMNCPDTDLCSTCEAHTAHPKTHVFVKIKVPLPILNHPAAQPLWYPGDRHRIHPQMSAALRQRLQQKYSFEGPQIDAFYDQFICLANRPWHSDPSDVGAAIDRRAFTKAMTSDSWSAPLAPNLVYDMMFAFYDTNNDELIGFEEFIAGLSYLRGPDRFASLHRALRGFDIDGDGFVSRRDFLRMFRAKYAIQNKLIRDMVDAKEVEHSQRAMDTLRSSQPISSAFTDEDIPQGFARSPEGKTADPFGDLQPRSGMDAIAEIYGDEESRDTMLGRQVSVENGRVLLRANSNRALDAQLARLDNAIHGNWSSSGADANIREGLINERKDRAELYTDAEEQPFRFSREEMRSLGLDNYKLPMPEREFGGDVLFQVVEEGFNEMLDRVFRAKEDLANRVSGTTDERRALRKHIDDYVKAKARLQEELRSGAMVDPLLAAAMAAQNVAARPQAAAQRLTNGLPHDDQAAEGDQRPFRAELVPTDPESLGEVETGIRERTLEELLETAGYSTVDESYQNQQRPTVNEDGFKYVLSSEVSKDPTMPQNRPDGSEAITTQHEMADSSPQKAITYDTNPTEARLELLAKCDEEERQISERGGPGRLSYEEVERIVKANSSKELKGLVTSWLEYASF